MSDRINPIAQYFVRKWFGIVTAYIVLLFAGLVSYNRIVPFELWLVWVPYVGSIALFLHTAGRVANQLRHVAVHCWRKWTPPFDEIEALPFDEAYPDERLARRNAVIWLGVSYSLSTFILFPPVNNLLWNHVGEIAQSNSILEALFLPITYSQDLLGTALKVHAADFDSRMILVMVLPVLVPMLFCVSNVVYALEASCQRVLVRRSSGTILASFYTLLYLFLSINFVFATGIL